jgi:hypothetical protein
MKMELTEESFPGYNEDIQLQEYEKIKEVINEKYKCNLNATEVRTEFEDAYNKLFSVMLAQFPDKVFKIIELFMDEFNIDEVKAVRNLNEENREKVRSFAITNYNTSYYQKIEKRNEKEKMERLGKGYNEVSDLRDLFV